MDEWMATDGCLVDLAESTKAAKNRQFTRYKMIVSKGFNMHKAKYFEQK